RVEVLRHTFVPRVGLFASAGGHFTRAGEARFDDWALLQSQSDIMNNQNIGVRLGIVFSFLIAVLIGIGWLGLNRMGRIHGDMEKIVKNRWLKVQLAREALNYSALNSRITMEIFLLREKDEIAPLLARRAENSQKVSDLLKKIEGG